jgi:hypothetical protein
MTTRDFSSKFLLWESSFRTQIFWRKVFAETLSFTATSCIFRESGLTVLPVRAPPRAARVVLTFTKLCKRPETEPSAAILMAICGLKITFDGKIIRALSSRFRY